MSNKKVVIVGGGIAGMEASAYLAAMGYQITLIEKLEQLGGHLVNWERLFPTKRIGKEVLEFLHKGIDEKVNVRCNTRVKSVERKGKTFDVVLDSGEILPADALLITTGYDVFDARRKEEYGYGIYDNVITSAEMEKIFLEGRPILTSKGEPAKRIGFIHCVGSRDEKIGNIHCSKVCCVTAVKQATEVKERMPDASVFCFYMDLRMYGRHFENLYKESQEKWGVSFIRGRLSEACENADGSILVKVEDTLTGRPLKMSLDLLVLLVGMQPSEGTKSMGAMLNIEFSDDGFMKTADEHTRTNISNIPGVFLAGTCVGPRTITNTIVDARAAASSISCYLQDIDIL